MISLRLFFYMILILMNLDFILFNVSETQVGLLNVLNVRTLVTLLSE